MREKDKKKIPPPPTNQVTGIEVTEWLQYGYVLITDGGAFYTLMNGRLHTKTINSNWRNCEMPLNALMRNKYMVEEK